ncbi:MAG: hypothetical protein ACKVS9_15155 [Phycisphaerae bacterium]
MREIAIDDALGCSYIASLGLAPPRRHWAIFETTLSTSGWATRAEESEMVDDANCGIIDSIMVELNAHFDGKVIVPDEPLALKPNQRVRIQIEPIDQPLPQADSKRCLGLQRGAVVYLAEDFDAELGDDFWLGEGQ